MHTDQTQVGTVHCCFEGFIVNQLKILAFSKSVERRLDLREACDGAGWTFFEATTVGDAKTVVHRTRPDAMIFILGEDCEIEYLALGELRSELDIPCFAVDSLGRNAIIKRFCEQGAVACFAGWEQCYSLLGTVRNIDELRKTKIALEGELEEQKNIKAISTENYNELLNNIQVMNRTTKERAMTLSFISHDFRSPLHVIQGYLGFLLDSHLDSAQASWLAGISNACENLLELATDVLDMQREGLNNLTQKPCKTDLRELTTNIVGQNKILGEEKGVSVLHEYSNSAPSQVMVDPRRIRQIIQNLLGNAIKFTKAGTVVLQVDGKLLNASAYLIISVLDDGPGLPEGAEEKMFGEFTQLEQPNEARKLGYGLGLAISKSLVHSLGGKIGVDRRTPHGSRFWVKLKLEALDEPSVAPSAAPGPQDDTESTGLRVLIAEDDVMSQKMLRRILSRMGCAVSLARNGREAVDEFAASDCFDAVIVDSDMPLMDGFEATRWIRRKEKNDLSSPTPIIAVTDLEDSHEKKRLLDAGANGLLVKPFVVSEVEATLRKHLFGDLN